MTKPQAAKRYGSHICLRCYRNSKDLEFGPIQSVAKGALDFVLANGSDGSNAFAKQCFWYDVDVIQVNDRFRRKTFALPDGDLLRDASDCSRDFCDDYLVEICICCRAGQKNHGPPADWFG